jgi:hypothetical protein
MKDAKKQIPLRINEKLWDKLNAWANDDFRSLNGQIEWLLTECVKNREKGKSFGTADNSNTEAVNKDG